VTDGWTDGRTPRPSAVNKTLPAFAAELGRLQAAVDIDRYLVCRRCRRPQLSIDISRPQGTQQQASRTPLLLSIDGTDRRTGGQPTVACTWTLLCLLCGQPAASTTELQICQLGTETTSIYHTRRVLFGIQKFSRNSDITQIAVFPTETPKANVPRCYRAVRVEQSCCNSPARSLPSPAARPSGDNAWTNTADGARTVAATPYRSIPRV